MAVYHFCMKHGSRAKGTSSGAHCRYILREGRYRSTDNDLQHSESGNMPKWASEAKYFWDRADEFEASNARLYTEFEVAFPRELSTEQQIELAQAFIKNEIGDRHAYTLAIHESTSQDGGTNPHMHLMFCTRLMDGIERDEYTFFKKANPNSPELGGAPKDRSWMPKQRLEALRLSWEQHANQALERAGQEARIDSRSLKDQGIDRSPQPKLTPMDVKLWKSGVINSTVEQVLFLREIAKIQANQEELRGTLSILAKIAHLGDFSERATQTLDKQQTHLKSLVERRETADRTVDMLTRRIGDIPKTNEDALKEARTRLYGRAYVEHHVTIKRAQTRLTEANERLTAYRQRPLAILFELPHVLDSFSDWCSARQESAIAQRLAFEYLESMKSKKVEAECQRIATQTLEERKTILAERDRALERALEVRGDLDRHSAVAAELQSMIEDAAKSVDGEIENLSPVLQQIVLTDGETVEIGQDGWGEKQQKGVELELAHKFEHSITQENSSTD